MFKKFSLKIRINVLSVVSVMLAIQFILTYILFFSIFREDFNRKSGELGNQIINHVNLRLQHVEEAARLFCNENDIYEALDSFDSSMTNNLSTLLTASNDIKGCFISGEKNSYYYSSVYIRDFGNFADFIIPRFERAGKNGYWGIYAPEGSEEQNYLIYSYPIRDEKQRTIGVLSVDVSLKTLYNATEMFDTELMEYTTVYISSKSDNKRICFTAYDEASHKTKNAKSRINSHHYADDIYMNTATSLEYIHSKLSFVMVLMVTIFVVTLVLLFIILHAYSKHLTKRMTDLTYKMNNFIERD